METPRANVISLAKQRIFVQNPNYFSSNGVTVGRVWIADCNELFVRLIGVTYPVPKQFPSFAFERTATILVRHVSYAVEYYGITSVPGEKAVDLSYTVKGRPQACVRKRGTEYIVLFRTDVTGAEVLQIPFQKDEGPRGA